MLKVGDFSKLPPPAAHLRPLTNPPRMTAGGSL